MLNTQNNDYINIIFKPYQRYIVQNKPDRMIPGKVFFQSIQVSQQISKKYQLYLVLNGIFYDRLKLFGTKYLCLTVNDVLQIQLCVKGLNVYEDYSKLEYQQSQEENIVMRDFLKVIVPQSYKLMIENKTIDVKFRLNRINNHEQIKVYLTFQPVASFSRKKLAVAMSPTKNRTIKFNQNLITNSPISCDAINQNHEKYQGSTPYDNLNLLPEDIDFSRQKNIQGEMSPPASWSNSKNHKQQANRKSFPQTMKQHQTLQQKTSKQNEKKPNNMRLQLKTQQDRPHFDNNTFDLFQSYETIPQNQVLSSSRAHNDDILIGDHILESNLQQQELPSSSSSQQSYQHQHRNHNPGNDSQFQQKSNQMNEQMDTLESLAYQREKILGQLFGKFNKNSR